MKSLMIITLLAGVTSASCSGQRVKQDKVPSIVVNTLRAAYPAAADIEWKKVSGHYEAELDHAGGNDITMRIDASGKTLMVKEDLPVAALAPAIASHIGDKYAGYTIDDADKIEKEGVVYYQVELDARKKKDVQLVFAADGSLAQSLAYWD